MKCVKINSKQIFAFESKNQFIDFVQGQSKILIALNAEKLNNSEAQLDKIINENIGYPDGIGAVLALRRKGIKTVKIPGVELWLDIITRFYKTKSFYLIGATQEVIKETVEKLFVQFPGIKILGFRNGFLNEKDKNLVLKDIKTKRPDFVFVAQGSPRQELLMAEFKNEYKAIYMGLGGSFDVYSEIKHRAPRVFIRFGLEWLYRLLKEPTRVTRQVNLIKFSIKIIFDRL